MNCSKPKRGGPGERHPRVTGTTAYPEQGLRSRPVGRHTAAFSVLLAVLCSGPLMAAEIKFATLAPEGTNAMKTMRLIDSELKEATKGAVSFKFYAGGRQGDEKDVVRKIRLGQLHSGGFTGVGLGEIAPEVRILDAPWLFKDTEEIDHIYEAFAGEFEKAFDSKGFVLLGWSEVGFVHVFSKTPARTLLEMRRLKSWVWEGDPIAESAYKALGIHPIPLSVTDVNTSLQTGLIDSVYSAPLYAIALQWHEKTRFINQVPVAHACGAVLLAKKVFDALTPEQQAALLKISRRRLGELNLRTRKDNDAALESLKKQGLQITSPAPSEDPKAYENAGRAARRELVGRLYSGDLLARVEKSLEEFRSRRKSPPDKSR